MTQKAKNMKKVTMPPLRYRVSALNQLPKCLSNNSRQLHIHYSEFLNNDILIGKKITVEHDDLGELYCKIFDIHGRIITETPVSIEEAAQEKEQLIKDLAKFGFYIEYSSLPLPTTEQLEYLKTIEKMGYDKFRLLNVYHVNESQQYIYEEKLVGFISSQLPKWLNNTHTSSISEFKSALASSYAINLSLMSDFNISSWQWLEGIVVGISDIEDEIKSNGALRVMHGDHIGYSSNLPKVSPHGQHVN